MKTVIEKENGSKLTIVTNRHWYPVLYGWDLQGRDRKQALNDYDYLLDEEKKEGEEGEGERFETHHFFKYKREIHDLDDYMRITPMMRKDFPGWDGYSSDSFFSGTLIKYSDDYESIQIGWYYS